MDRKFTFERGRNQNILLTCLHRLEMLCFKKCMNLRDHPKMSYRGLPIWPPSWVHCRTKPIKRLQGEIGEFGGVWLSDHARNRLFLRMSIDGELYMGCIAFTSSDFCRQVHDLLQSHIGQTIKDIGDLDIDLDATVAVHNLTVARDKSKVISI